MLWVNNMAKKQYYFINWVNGAKTLEAIMATPYDDTTYIYHNTDAHKWYIVDINTALSVACASSKPRVIKAYQEVFERYQDMLNDEKSYKKLVYHLRDMIQQQFERIIN